MIRAMIFDLDGTLVQTERLKALSYARATAELCPHEVSEHEVIEAFKGVVGLARQEVAQTLVEQFDLQEKAAERMANADYEVCLTPFGYFFDLDIKAPGLSLARIFKDIQVEK